MEKFLPQVIIALLTGIIAIFFFFVFKRKAFIINLSFSIFIPFTLYAALNIVSDILRLPEIIFDFVIPVIFSAALSLSIYLFIIKPLEEYRKNITFTDLIFRMKHSLSDIELKTKEIQEKINNKEDEFALVVDQISAYLTDYMSSAENTENNLCALSEKIKMLTRTPESNDNYTNLFDKTIEIMYSLDKSIERTVTEMKNQSNTLQITFDAFDVTTLSMERVDEVTKEAKRLADNLSSIAIEGAKSVEQTTTAISEIAKSSQAMQEILSTITEISEKTNLLAINAAIEAANAGLKGRGFAIVAKEVRKLAMNTSKSAVEIKEIIDQIFNRIDKGIEVISQTKTVFDQILSDIEQTNTLNQEIYEISRKNVIQGKEIITAVNQLKSIANRIIKASSDELFETNEVVIALNEINTVIKQISEILHNTTSFGKQNVDILNENIEYINKIKSNLRSTDSSLEQLPAQD